MVNTTNARTEALARARRASTVVACVATALLLAGCGRAQDATRAPSASNPTCSMRAPECEPGSAGRDAATASDAGAPRADVPRVPPGTAP